MEIETVLKFGIVFLIGFLSANLIGFYFVYGTELPVLKDLGVSQAYNNQAPYDFVKQNQIEVYSDKIVINIRDASIGSYAATGSMKPVLDENSNGIRIKPSSEEDIHVGDIITYETDGNLIIHRVVEKGSDENGTYFVPKGDNNSVNDGKIRFKDIRYKTIGLIY
jgi:signal peptidase I